MRVEKKERWIEVYPEEGMMLYNGETVSDGLIAPFTADLSAWREITIEEAQKIQEELESEDFIPEEEV